MFSLLDVFTFDLSYLRLMVDFFRSIMAFGVNIFEVWLRVSDKYSWLDNESDTSLKQTAKYKPTVRIMITTFAIMYEFVMRRAEKVRI